MQIRLLVIKLVLFGPKKAILKIRMFQYIPVLNTGLKPDRPNIETVYLDF